MSSGQGNYSRRTITACKELGSTAELKKSNPLPVETAALPSQSSRNECPPTLSVYFPISFNYPL